MSFFNDFLTFITPTLTLCASVIFLTPQLQHTTTAESQSSLMALLAKFLIIKDCTHSMALCHTIPLHNNFIRTRTGSIEGWKELCRR